MSQSPADRWSIERPPPASSWRDRLRWPRGLPVAAPSAAPPAGQSAVINAQLWMDQAPWRPAALWAAVAGLLTAGSQAGPLDWRTVLLVLLLADLLWGGLWRLAGGRTALAALPVNGGGSVWLPYLQAGSPAAQLFSGDNTDLWSYAVRVAVPTALLALAVAAVLGAPALALTGVALVVAALGWTMNRALQRRPNLLAALMTIGLPWLLALLQMGTPGAGGHGLAAFALLGLWTVHHWGELRAAAYGHDWLGLALMAASEIALCLLLIMAQAPLWLAPIVVLLLPTWLIVQRRGALGRVRWLWLGAMLLSAAALGQAA